MRLLVVGRKVAEGKLKLLGHRLKNLVVRQHRNDVGVERPLLVVMAQLFQAVRLTRYENRNTFAAFLSVQPNRDVHLHFTADSLERKDEFVEAARQVGQVDQHRHDEQPLHHALVDILDVDALLGEIGRNPGHDALLVATDDCDDGRTRRLGHGFVASPVILDYSERGPCNAARTCAAG